MTGDSIRLRPHHLLCMLTYVGEGYSKAFIKNFDALCEKINQGEAIAIIVSGPDDICAPLLCEEENCHCMEPDILDNDKKALDAINRTLSCCLHCGDKVTLSAEFIEELRTHFKSGEIRPACSGCEWFDLCGKVAEDNFIQGKIKS